MDFPTRTKQQKAESDSYAILIYKLRKLGIFRNVTQSDYGIDFEIELVLGDKITGRSVKAQVKAAQSVHVRKSDHCPTVPGIKQTTLAYWCELSFAVPVVGFAVDLTNENIYVSKPLFWQASKMMDGSGKSKSIEFLPNKNYTSEALFVQCLTSILQPTTGDIIYAQKSALRHLPELFELYVDVFHYDGHMELDRLDLFRTFLELCRILLWEDSHRANLPESDREHAFSFNHWANKAGIHSGTVTNHVAQVPIKVLLPLLIKTLALYQEYVLEGAYYWSHRNPEYLGMVYNAPLPRETDDSTLMDWGYKYEQLARSPVEDVSMLIARVHRKAQELKAAEMKTKADK